MSGHADTIRRLQALIDEAVALQQADPEPDHSSTRWKDLRDSLVIAALYEIPELVAENQHLRDALEQASVRLGELTQPPWNEFTPLVAEVRDDIRAALAGTPSSRAVDSPNDRYAIEHPHGDWHVCGTPSEDTE